MGNSQEKRVELREFFKNRPKCQRKVIELEKALKKPLFIGSFQANFIEFFESLHSKKKNDSREFAGITR